MRRYLLMGLPLLALAAPARADVVVRAPYVEVRVGNPIVVRAPFVTVVVPRRSVPVMAAPVRAPVPVAPGEQLPIPSDATPARPVPSVGAAPPPQVVRPLSVAEFARTFKAVPKRASYEVVLAHPCTGEAVKVCFDLPGCPRRIRASKTSLEFRYGLCKAVVVRFNRDGTVQVR
jgi:hypothetical protein